MLECLILASYLPLPATISNNVPGNNLYILFYVYLKKVSFVIFHFIFTTVIMYNVFYYTFSAFNKINSFINTSRLLYHHTLNYSTISVVFI